MCKLGEDLHMRLGMWISMIYSLDFVTVLVRCAHLDVVRIFSYPTFPRYWLCHLVDDPSQVCRRTRSPPQTGLLKLLRQADCFECDCLVHFTCASSLFGVTAKSLWPQV